MVHRIHDILDVYKRQLLGFIPAVYGIFSILREVIGLGMYLSLIHI